MSMQPSGIIETGHVLDEYERQRLETGLQAVSNVIELKPGKKYLLVFKGDGISVSQVDYMLTLLREHDIRALGVGLYDGQEIEVIEIPEEHA